jgi:hypothetical protein
MRHFGRLIKLNESSFWFVRFAIITGGGIAGSAAVTVKPHLTAGANV